MLNFAKIWMIMDNIAIIGRFSVALAIAKKFPNTVGFDINEAKIAALKLCDRLNIRTHDVFAAAATK